MYSASTQAARSPAWRADAPFSTSIRSFRGSVFNLQFLNLFKFRAALRMRIHTSNMDLAEDQTSLIYVDPDAVPDVDLDAVSDMDPDAV